MRPQYPGPRLRGTTRLPSGQVIQAPPLPSAAGGNTPQVRLWPFHLREAGLTSTALVVSPRLTGPALLRRVVLTMGQGAGNPMAGFQIYKSLDDAGAGTNIANTVAVSGTKLWDPLTIQDDQGVITASPDLGPTTNDTQVSPPHLMYDLDITITDPTFYLKVRLIQNNAGAAILDGWLHIIENLTPEQLATFL